jgi:hypothetical protein
MSEQRARETAGGRPDGPDEGPAGAAAPDGAELRSDGGSVGAAPTAGRETTALPPGGLSLRPGFLLGIAAFLGSYAVLYSLRASELASSVLPLPAAGSPEVPQVVGWLLYRAHFVPIEYTIEGTVGTVRGVVRSGGVPAALERLAQALEPGTLLLVPLFMLFVCGFYAGIEADAADPQTGAAAGASVVVGYLLVVVVAVAAITWSVSQSVFDVTVTVAIGPETVRAVLFAGLLYPLAGGAIGGAAAGAVAE